MNVKQLNWQSLIVIKILGLLFGLFLSKKFVNTFISDTKDNDETMHLFYNYAKITNQLRFILFWIIGPFIFVLIIYLIN